VWAGRDADRMSADPEAVYENISGVGAQGQSQKVRRQREAVARRSAVARGLATGDVAGRGGDDRRRGGRSALRLPRVAPVYDALIDSCSGLTACADALDAELWLSRMWGQLLTQTPPTAQLDLVMLDLVDEAERVATVDCLVLLRTMAVIDVSGCAEAAGAAAVRLAARRGEQPDAVTWLDRLGDVTLAACDRFTDTFGEQVRLVCQFVYPGQVRRHAVVVTIDRTCRGALGGIELLASPAAVDGLLRRLTDHARRGHGRFEPVAASQATDLMRSSLLAVTLPREAPSTSQPALVPTLDVSVQALLPILAQRLTAMSPGSELTSRSESPDVEGPVALAWPAERRAGLVTEFLTARQAALRGVELPGMLAARVVDLSLDVLDWPPDRVGPLTVSRLVREVIPRSLLAPEPVLMDLERVVHEWLTWRLEALELRRWERGRLQLGIQAATRALPGRCRDRSIQPQYPYVADLPRDQAGGRDLFAVLARRCFAVPLPGGRGDGLVQLNKRSNGLPARSTHVDDLDAARDTHRLLITAIEQSAHGTRRDEFPARVGVVQQLWDDDPGQVWAAARRLTAAGLPRHRVIETLARLWQRHSPADPAALESGRVPPGPERDSYLTALIALH